MPSLKSFPRPLKNKKVFTGYLVVLALIIIPVVTFLLRPNNSEDLAKTEVESITAKVGSIMDLPAETPTVATVSDASKLKNQAFFAQAQNGDKVLIFAKAQKAILYRPTTDKIVEVALYKPPAGGSQPTGEVAGVQDAPVSTPSPVPTQGFSLKDLLKDEKTSVSSVPSKSPSPEPTIIQ